MTLMEIINWLLGKKSTQEPLILEKGIQMKTVRIKRTEHTDKVTRGTLTVENVQHEPIYTLENPKRATKDDSCIPAGEYTCIPHTGLHYKDVYEVTNVPGRSAILIHNGNTEKDTLGCILIGNKLGAVNNEPAVLESKVCLERFRNLIGKEKFKLIIED